MMNRHTKTIIKDACVNMLASVVALVVLYVLILGLRASMQTGALWPAFLGAAPLLIALSIILAFRRTS